MTDFETYWGRIAETFWRGPPADWILTFAMAFENRTRTQVERHIETPR